MVRAARYLTIRRMGLNLFIALASLGCCAFMLFVLRSSVRDAKVKPKMRSADGEPPRTQPLLVKRGHGARTRGETKAHRARTGRLCWPRSSPQPHPHVSERLVRERIARVFMLRVAPRREK